MTTTPGALLRIIRQQAGLSIRAAADLAHVPARRLAAVENGRDDASPAWLGTVAAALSAALAASAPAELRADIAADSIGTLTAAGASVTVGQLADVADRLDVAPADLLPAAVGAGTSHA